jgi:hypothetical protein
MLIFLQYLEPRQISKKTIILDEFDEVIELLFVTKGQVVIGYEVNKVKKYCVKVRDKCMIGSNGVAQNQRSEFIYCALTRLECLTIRKEKWMGVQEESPEVAQKFMSNIL